MKPGTVLTFCLAITFCITAFMTSSFAQGFNNRTQIDEGVLNASTKQLNQFFRRFNGEESTRGQRYYEGDKEYRSQTLRSQYLKVLFDEQNNSLNSSLKTDFINAVNSASGHRFLDFHGDNWFAEVTTKFLYQGADVYITLFMNLEQENLGYKWVMSNVYFPHFSKLLTDDEKDPAKFLHPMSHEIDFMNLVRVFNDRDNVIQYTEKDYEPDYLSLFLYELKKGNLKYQSVTNLKFHFFQVDGWYFEVSNFNRPGTNSGWLISNLTKFEKPDDKEIIIKFIQHVQ